MAVTAAHTCRSQLTFSVMSLGRSDTKRHELGVSLSPMLPPLLFLVKGGVMKRNFAARDQARGERVTVDTEKGEVSAEGSDHRKDRGCVCDEGMSSGLWSCGWR